MFKKVICNVAVFTTLMFFSFLTWAGEYFTYGTLAEYFNEYDSSYTYIMDRPNAKQVLKIEFRESAGNAEWRFTNVYDKKLSCITFIRKSYTSRKGLRHEGKSPLNCARGGNPLDVGESFSFSESAGDAVKREGLALVWIDDLTFTVEGRPTTKTISTSKGEFGRGIKYTD